MKSLNSHEIKEVSAGILYYGDSAMVVSSYGIPDFYYQVIESNYQGYLNGTLSQYQCDHNVGTTVPWAYVEQYRANLDSGVYLYTV